MAFVDAIAVLCAGAAVFIHSTQVTTLGASFLRYDDQVNFVDNPLLARGAPLGGSIAQTLHTSVLGCWEPLSLTVKIVVANVLGNGDRAAPLMVSIWMFGLAVGILYTFALRVARAIVLPREGGGGEGSSRNAAIRCASATATFLFVTSPDRVELIAWASAQPYIIMLLFSGIFALAVLELRTTERSESYLGVPYRVWMYILCVVFYTCAVSSKAAAVPLLVLPLAIELAVLRDWRQSYTTLSLTAFLSLAAAILGRVHLNANAALGSRSDAQAVHLKLNNVTTSLFGNSAFEEKALASFSFYLLRPFHFFRPRCVHYEFNDAWEWNGNESHACSVPAGPSFLRAFGAVAVVYVLLAGITASKWAQRLATALFTIFALSSPGIVAAAGGLHGAAEGGAAHDRYGVLAHALVTLPGVAVIISAGTLRALKIAKDIEPEFDHPNATRVLKVLAILLAVLPGMLVSVVSVQTSLETAYRKWDTTETLWKDAIAHNPNDRHALASLGECLSLECEGLACQKAISYMERSVQQGDARGSTGTAKNRAKLADLHFNLGTVQYRSGNIVAARSAFKRSVELKPHDPEAVWRYLKLCLKPPDVDGNAFFTHLDNALKIFSHAKVINDPKTRPRVEWIAEQYKATEDKVLYLNGVLAFFPPHFSCYIHMLKAVELHQNHQLKLAARAYELAVNAPVQPRCMVARLNLARVYYGLREYSSALVHYAEWVKANPKDEEALREFEIVKEKAPSMMRDFSHLNAEEIQDITENFVKRRYRSRPDKQGGEKKDEEEEEDDGVSILV